MTHTIGATIVQRARGRAHAYSLASISPHTTAAGARTFVLTWVGHCARCGAAFAQTTGRSAPAYMIRTCEIHRGRK